VGGDTRLPGPASPGSGLYSPVTPAARPELPVLVDQHRYSLLLASLQERENPRKGPTGCAATSIPANLSDGKAFLPVEEALARVLLRLLSVTAIYLQQFSSALLFYGYNFNRKRWLKDRTDGTFGTKRRLWGRRSNFLEGLRFTDITGETAAKAEGRVLGGR
jgi:hypothetical protein